MNVRPSLFDGGGRNRSLARRAPRAGFRDLSDELLNMIKDFLPAKDLASHLALRVTCKRTWDIYTGQEEIWEVACLGLSLGRPRCVAKRSWMWIADTYAIHVHTCRWRWWGMCHEPCTFTGS